MATEIAPCQFHQTGVGSEWSSPLRRLNEGDDHAEKEESRIRG